MSKICPFLNRECIEDECIAFERSEDEEFCTKLEFGYCNALKIYVGKNIRTLPIEAKPAGSVKGFRIRGLP